MKSPISSEKLKGLLATAMAIGLMASWSAFAANGNKTDPQIRSLEVVAVAPTAQETVPTKLYGVKVSVEPLTGTKGKCTKADRQELPKTIVNGKTVYQFTTPNKPGKDFGVAYFQRCERGQYQVSIDVPSGYALEDPTTQKQIVKLDTKHTTTLEFKLKKQK